MALLLIIFLLLAVGVARLLEAGPSLKLPWYIDPVIWFVTPWCVGLLLLSLPFVEYRENLTLVHVAYIFACIFSFIAGTLISAFFERRQRHVAELTDQVPILKFSARIALAFIALASIGYFVGIFDAINSTGVGFFERFTPSGFARAREMRKMVAMTRGAPNEFLSGLTALAFFYLVYVRVFLDQIHEHPRRRTILAGRVFIIGLIVFDAVVINGGRLQIVLLCLMLGASALLDRRKNRLALSDTRSRLRRWLVIGSATIAAFLVIGVFSTVFVQQRTNSIDPQNILYWGHRAKLSRLAQDAAKENELFGYALFTSTYLTVPITTLTVYLDLPASTFPGPYLGQFNVRPFAGMIIRRFDERLGANWSTEHDVPLAWLGFGRMPRGCLLAKISGD